MGGWHSQYPKDKHVVIVGAGYAGSEFGKQLLKRKANFTLIDQRNYMHDNIRATRAAVIPGLAKKTIIQYGPTFGNHFKLGKVVDLNPRERKVIFSTGAEVKYDTLVIATGTKGPFPTKLGQLNETDALRQYEDITQKVKNSTKIAVIGGGAAGVEMAADIADFYPSKRVTLLHSGPQILNYKYITQEFRSNIMNILTTRLGINTMLGERVMDLNQTAKISTSEGKEIDTDLVIQCTGLKVNSDAYSKSLGHATDKTGQLEVNAYFQVVGLGNIFAIGDCCRTDETKLAVVGQEHAKHLADNLAKHYQGKPMKPYKPNKYPVIMKIPLGQRHEEILFRT